MQNMSLKEKLVEFLSHEARTLHEIYEQFQDQKRTTIRGRLNENVGSAFRRISRGVYLAIQGDTKALVIEGDSWETLKEFKTGSIDAIITDHGYTCLNHHYQAGTTRERNKNKDIGFATTDMDEELLGQLFRVLKQGGHFFTFLPADAADTLDYNNAFITMARETGFSFNKRFIWDKKRIGMGYNGRNRYEQILFFSKGERNMPNDMSVPDVLAYDTLRHDRRLHHAQKPVPLLADLIRFCSQENDVLLDPFAGSLSLTAAGFETNRHTICIEKDQDMLKNALRTRTAQPKLTCFCE